MNELAEVDGAGTPEDRRCHAWPWKLLLRLSLPGDAILDVTINENWVLVQRGSATLDPKTFRVDALYTDRLGLLGH